MMKKLGALMLLGGLVACGQQEKPQVAEGYELQAVQLFNEACVHHLGQWQEVAQWAKLRDWKVLAPEQAAQFLPQSGAHQQGWQKQDESGNRMVLVQNPQGCTLAVKYANEDRIRQAFKELAEHPQGLAAHMQANYHSDTPFDLNQLLYAWQDLSAASSREILLQATTSSSEKAPMQAVLNIYTTIAPNRGVIANP